MKGKILVSTLVAVLILAAMTAPTFAAKPANPGTNPLDVILAEINSLWARINGDVMLEGENISLLYDDIGYLDNETDPLFGASAAAAITSDNISDWNTVDWTEISGIPEGFSDPQYYAIPHCAFQPDIPERDCEISQVPYLEGFYLGDGLYYAPVNLPDGAYVSEFAAKVWTASDNQVMVQLWRELDTTFGVSFPIVTLDSGDSTSWLWLEDTTLDYYVDNQNYIYFVVASASDWGIINRVRIKFQYPPSS